MHHFVRVICGRIFDHGNIVTEFGGIANGRLNARMRDESDDDELLDAVLLELQIQIGAGETTGAPMLLGDDLARLRCEFAANLSAPGAVFESLVRPSCFLDGRNVFPCLVVALAVAMVQGIEDAKLRPPRSVQDLQHMRNTSVCFGDRLQTVPDFAALRNEIVVGVNDDECGDLFCELWVCHTFCSSVLASAVLFLNDATKSLHIHARAVSSARVRKPRFIAALMGGTLLKSEASPSGMVGWVRIASRTAV